MGLLIGYVSALISLGALGCEREYGVVRTTVLARLPDLSCISRVLEATSGINSVRVASAGDDEPSGAPDPGDHHYFFFEGPRVDGELLVVVEEQGTIRFSQSFVLVNEKPPQEVIDTTRAVMRTVERRLEADCGMKGLSADVQEICLRVSCQDNE